MAHEEKLGSAEQRQQESPVERGETSSAAVKSRKQDRARTSASFDRDCLTPKRFLEPLARVFERDAHLVQGASGAGRLLAESGEVVEFGLGDTSRARELFRRSSEHEDADPRAFAALRRLARADHDSESIRAAYSTQFERARCIEDKVVAACCLAMFRLRRGEDSRSILEFLTESEPLLDACSVQVRALFMFVLEDAQVRNARYEDAVATRSRRFTDYAKSSELSAVQRADAALAVASLHEAVGMTEDVTLTWFETAFEASPSPEALAPLLRRVCREEAWDVAESLLADAIERSDDDDFRTSCRYQLGMLRAFRRGDRAGGLQLLGEAMKSGQAAPLAATAFLAIARSSHGSVLPDEFVDALSARLDFSASPVERADLLTQMALRFDGPLEMPEAAVEMAREALDCCPTWVPAMRCLSTIYSREGEWERFVELQTRLLEFEADAHEKSRIHMRLARVYQLQLHELDHAEQHLLAAIELGCESSPARQLADLYAAQHRWEELHRHLMQSAEAMSSVREKTYFTVEAAEVAEHKLRRTDLAIDSYLALLQLDTTNATAMSSLDRLYQQTERWSDLLRLNEHELSLLKDDKQAQNTRLALLCRCARLANERLSDLTRAESYLRDALELDATYGDALRELGAILSRQGRWPELVEMTQQQLREVDSDVLKARCYRQLGEIYATQIGDSKRAIACFRKLGEQGGTYAEEARIWLERLYEAAGMPEARLDILRERRESADDNASAARLSYRIAELLDWELNRPTEAFVDYLDALADPSCVDESLRALTRLWEHRGLTRREHLTAIRTIQDAAGRLADPQRRAALTFVAEQGNGVLDDEARRAVWSTVAREWPDELKAAEFLATIALRDGDVELAEEVRARRPAGPVEAARARLAHLDRGLDSPAWESGFEVPDRLAAVISRENGVPSGFPGAADRARYMNIRNGDVTLDSLRGDRSSEAAARLSIMAAREMGEQVAFRREWQELIGSFDDNRRALRGWLDLCEEESSTVAERTRWLRDAEALGCYEHGMREALYTAFQSNTDLEGFVVAIENHLCNGGVEGERAARLALRQAHALDHLGRREEALDALRFANIHAPSLTEAAVEKARIEMMLDQLDAARQTLEDVLDAGSSGPERLEVLGRLADLHLMDGGDHSRAISALEDAWELSGRNREWGFRLAIAQSSYGDPARAATLLKTALDTPPIESELRYWFMLARLQEGPLDEPGAAEKTLWAVFEQYPTKTKCLEALYSYYKKRSGASRFAARLRDLLIDEKLNVTEEQAATLWLYVGELFYAVLRALPEAEYAYEAAARLDGERAKTSLKLARCVAEQGRREKEALVLAKRALLASDANRDTWNECSSVIESIFDQLDDPTRLDMARQLKDLCSATESGARTPSRSPSKPLSADRVWGLLGTEGLALDERSVLQAAAPLAEKILVPSKRRKRAKKLDATDGGYFADALDRFCWALDTETPKVFTSEEDSEFLVSDQGLLIGSSRVYQADEVTAQFWAGRAAAAAFTEMGVLLDTEDVDVMNVIRAVATKSLGYEFEGAEAFVDHVSGFLIAPQRRPVASALKDVPGFVDLEECAWSASLQRICDRFGLLACGDLRVAAHEVALLDGAAVDPSRSSRVRDLVRFALSDAYHVARYELGVARRPILMDGAEQASASMLAS